MANVFTVLVLLGMLSHAGGACSCSGCTDTKTVSTSLQIAGGSCSNGKKAAVDELKVQSTDGSIFKVYTSTSSYYSAGFRYYSDGGTSTTVTCFNMASNIRVGAEESNIYVYVVCENSYYNCPIKFDVRLVCLTPSKTSDGGSCSSPSQCTSGVCRGSNCCGSKGRSTGCTDCDSDGDCDTCSSGYTNSNYQCVASKKSSGSTCSYNSDCSSTYCKVRHCSKTCVFQCAHSAAQAVYSEDRLLWSLLSAFNDNHL